MCRDRTLQRKGSGPVDIDLAHTEEQKILEDHGQDLNAAISAAWKALPEAKKREYKAKANAKKLSASSFRVHGQIPKPFGTVAVPISGTLSHVPSQEVSMERVLWVADPRFCAFAPMRACTSNE